MEDPHRTWFTSFSSTKDFEYLIKHPIAYFCAEFAVNDSLQTYAGGLGVLAGDYLREARDRQLPVVGVGLYYPEGYVCKELGDEGVRVKTCPKTLPEQTELKQVLQTDGTPLTVRVPLFDYHIYLQAWKIAMGPVTIYFLDPNVPQNKPEDRGITSKLYDADKPTRLKQEILLGIGGYRLLKQLEITPSVFHLNEGHSALLALEITHEEMQRHHSSFAQAVAVTHKKIVFTNHTLVQAANDVFGSELVATILNHYAQELQVPITDIISLGLIPDSNMFSMTTLALTISGKTNAVSSLHAKSALSIWPSFSMETVTNGIHLASWSKTHPLQVTKETHAQNKKKLIEYINMNLHTSWDEKTLLLGWARRMVAYKRPLAIIDDMNHFLSLGKKEGREFRVVFSGVAHHDDEEGHQILEVLQQKIREGDNRILYLPGYNMELAKLLAAGCDVWLNTPIVGYEACGTSGMKAALNGVLSCTTNDGWVAEIDINKTGWMIESEDITANMLYLLEQKIIPEYYSWQNGASHVWEEKMNSAATLIMSQFSTTRMLREYIEKLYLPLIQPQTFL